MSNPKPTRELPEFVDDLVRIGVAELVAQLRTPEDEAQKVMAKIADGIVNEYGRRSMYIPAGFGSRNSEIWRKYCLVGDGGVPAYSYDRVAQLAQEYNLTTRQVYAIIGVMRTREIAERQKQLPGFEQPA